jgi:hypothetical protein
MPKEDLTAVFSKIENDLDKGRDANTNQDAGYFGSRAMCTGLMTAITELRAIRELLEQNVPKT